MQGLPAKFWNAVTQAYSAPAKVDFDARTNAFTIKNAGTTIVMWDDEPLQPGESKSYQADIGELFVGRKDLYFVIPTPAPAVITNLAFVTINYYVIVDPVSPNYVKDY